VDPAGIPLAISLTADNRDDVTQLLPLVDGPGRCAASAATHGCRPRV